MSGQSALTQGRFDVGPFWLASASVAAALSLLLAACRYMWKKRRSKVQIEFRARHARAAAIADSIIDDLPSRAPLPRTGHKCDDEIDADEAIPEAPDATFRHAHKWLRRCEQEADYLDNVVAHGAGDESTLARVTNLRV